MAHLQSPVHFVIPKVIISFTIKQFAAVILSRYSICVASVDMGHLAIHYQELTSAFMLYHLPSANRNKTSFIFQQCPAQQWPRPPNLMRLIRSSIRQLEERGKMIAGMYYGDGGYCSTSIGSLRNDHCTSGHSIGRPILICLSSASHQRAVFFPDQRISPLSLIYLSRAPLSFAST